MESQPTQRVCREFHTQRHFENLSVFQVRCSPRNVLYPLQVRPVALPRAAEFLYALLLVKKPLNTGASVNPFKSAAIFLVVVAMSGCERSQPTPPFELHESATSVGMKFKLIPAGTFTMGIGNEAHEVTLTKPFKMGVHEVTQAQYEQVMGVNPSHFKGAENPVEEVSWGDAVEFCRRLSDLPAEKAAGNVYRLPTEAEWEYACRAGTTTMYSFGDDDSELGDYAWFLENSGTKTHPVGRKQPNAWGLYDMHGNVWEWCQDRYGDYPSGSVTEPTGPAVGSARLIRGGCWFFTAGYCRSAYRFGYGPSNRINRTLGFRVCLSPYGQ